MKHWRVDQVAWDRFDRSKLQPEVVPLVKAAAMVERNANDYTAYLCGVFQDDPDFRAAAEYWAVEEVQHGDALGQWAMIADPGWDYQAAFTRYRSGYKIDTDATASIRGSRAGELIARCMVETGTSSYYTALSEATEEPVLKEICKLIAADEYRHFKLFYDHMKRYLGREKLSIWDRLRIAAGRVTETEDDELAFAFHCGNEPPTIEYEHQRCMAGYMGRAMSVYQPHHIHRAVSMMLKVSGLNPQGKLAELTARAAWHLLRRRRDRMQLALKAHFTHPEFIRPV